MHNHAPAGYACPMCQTGRRLDNGLVGPADIVYGDAAVTAFVAPDWWTNNPGHVLVIPNEHFENIYDLPVPLACEIHRVAREVALAFKRTYQCDGVSTRQHNEPAGNQHVWHYQLHVFPRYQGDDLYRSVPRSTTREERLPYAAKLRAYLPGGA